jgi:hypothetical protein
MDYGLVISTPQKKFQQNTAQFEHFYAENNYFFLKSRIAKILLKNRPLILTTLRPAIIKFFDY